MQQLLSNLSARSPQSRGIVHRMTYHHQPVDAFSVVAYDEFPPRELAHVGQTQIVTKVDYREDVVTLTFGDGTEIAEIAYQWGERVIFPRRPDGSRCAWPPSPPPLAREVYPGDSVYAGKEDETLMISSVSLTARRGIMMVRITGSTPYGPRRYLFMPTEPMRFPRREFSNSGELRRQPAGKLIWFGPYEHAQTKTRWEFSHHPHGHGRWPSKAPVYDARLPPTEDGSSRRARFPEFNWDPDLIPTRDGLPLGRVRGASRARRGETTFG